MKLRTKIFFSFFLFVLVPVLLLVLFFIVLSLFQATKLQQNYGIDLQNLPAGFVNIVSDFLVAIIMVLIVSAVVLSIWIYSGIRTPMYHLTRATKKIRDGDLDFEVKPEGVYEIRELCEDFEEMRQKLREANDEKLMADAQNRELISNISHDLRTPITTVKGYVEGVMDGIADTPEKMERYMKTIYAKANEMDHLINELTFYSKIDTNQMPYHFKKISAKEFFDDAAEELGRELQQLGIRFSYQNALAENETMVADVEQVQRVIANLIGNAEKYMDKEEKEVVLAVADVDDMVQVCVEDNGQGIPSTDLPHIFDRFYRGDKARSSKEGGSGIGLSIVKKIVEEHGGKVWAESVEGEGSKLFFTLRKKEAETVAPAAAKDEKKKKKEKRRAAT